MNWLYTSLILFAVAGLLGVYLLTFVLRKIETRKGIALIHGAAAAVALVILITFTINNQESRFYTGISILVITAIGGFVMIAKDLMGGRPPKWLALLHGILAIVGLTFILMQLR